MSKEKFPFDALRKYLPDHTFELVMPLIEQHKVHLTITRERQTKLGDYQNAYGNNHHRISVNGNLNKYAFLITLLHEFGHLLAYEQYGHRIQPHGQEWKIAYASILHIFLQHTVFPSDIAVALQSMMQNPAASSCSEEGLQRVLKKYDSPKAGIKTIEALQEGQIFQLTNGRKFCKGQRIRKRYRCTDIINGRIYLFGPLFEVIELY